MPISEQVWQISLVFRAMDRIEFSHLMHIVYSFVFFVLFLFLCSVSVSSKENDPPVPESWYKLMVPGAKYLYEKSPPNLPSVRLTEEEERKMAKRRHIYGGKGDKPHLGGFTNFDASGYSTNAFNYMIGHLGVRSMIDLGCGKGFSTKYFLDAGADVLCAEGSHDAVTQTLLPPNMVVEHDFTRGPWWPDRTFDALWSVEFLEHVGRQYMHYYMPVLHKAALIFVTSSGWGGWHHVEVCVVLSTTATADTYADTTTASIADATSASASTIGVSRCI